MKTINVVSFIECECQASFQWESSFGKCAHIKAGRSDGST